MKFSWIAQIAVVCTLGLQTGWSRSALENELCSARSLHEKKEILLDGVEAYQNQFASKALRVEGTSRGVSENYGGMYGGSASPANLPDETHVQSRIEFSALIDALGRSWEKSRTAEGRTDTYFECGLTANRLISLNYNQGEKRKAVMSCKNHAPWSFPEFQVFQGIRVALLDLPVSFDEINPETTFLEQFVDDAYEIQCNVMFMRRSVVSATRKNTGAVEHCYFQLEPVVHCVGWELRHADGDLTRVTVNYEQQPSGWLPVGTSRTILSQDKQGNLANIVVSYESEFSKFDVVDLPDDEDFYPKLGPDVEVIDNCDPDSSSPNAANVTEQAKNRWSWLPWALAGILGAMFVVVAAIVIQRRR